MTPQRRTALASVVAAGVLVAIKLGTGIASGSLGLVSEALHSGTDLVAALLTLFAIGVAGRPADATHQYGHGKAEHLAALAEAAFLALVSVGVAALALARLAGVVEIEVQPAWWAFASVALVIAIDLFRMVVSLRTARRYASAALVSNALHFGSDLAGTLAVLAGLVAAALGWPEGDSLAALFVAALVLVGAGRLMKANVDVLMDRSPEAAVSAARQAIGRLSPPVDLRRLRMRSAGGRHFADVVIGVLPGAAVGQGHAAADRVEEAVRHALPGADVVVHVEPRGAEEGLVRERAHAAALGVSHVREIHNVSVRNVEGSAELSLHLKLPGDLSLEDAHAVAEQVEQAILDAVPELAAVHTHIEPLAEEAVGREVPVDGDRISRLAEELCGAAPRELRMLHTDEGLVVLLTLALPPVATLAEAHARASELEERIRGELPGVAEVLVHTEP
jgi:cation diffusion facilitator family transporter